jgi:hypothetical protein
MTALGTTRRVFVLVTRWSLVKEHGGGECSNDQQDFFGGQEGAILFLMGESFMEIKILLLTRLKEVFSLKICSMPFMSSNPKKTMKPCLKPFLFKGFSHFYLWPQMQFFVYLFIYSKDQMAHRQSYKT